MLWNLGGPWFQDSDSPSKEKSSHSRWFLLEREGRLIKEQDNESNEKRRWTLLDYASNNFYLTGKKKHTVASIVSLYHTSILVCSVLFLMFFSGLGFIRSKLLSHVWLWHPMDCSRPGFCVLHYLPEFAQTPVSWAGDAIQSSHPATHFSFCLQSFPESESLPVSKLFVSGGQRIGASASPSVLPKYFQGCFLLRVTGVISLLSKWLSRVFSSSTIKKH